MYLEYHTSVISAYNDICSSLRNAWKCDKQPYINTYNYI